jgi:predicted transcriptional regulator of viral defense system
MPQQAKGKSSRSRERLSKLLREGGELLTVEQAARILELSNEDAAKSLARWCNQGWLARIKRGFYVAVPIEAAGADRALEDAWILVPELFGPAYVGGWSAAEHWDLTEQIFRDICVFTARPVTKRHQLLHNVPFVVRHAATEHHFGTKPVWKKDKKILVSDPAKTIGDMLSNPWTGGGIQHVADCLKQFFKSEQFNADQLVEYAEKLRNGAVFKRLGYLTAQILGESHPLVAACDQRLSKGNAQLDPALKGDRLITRWHLFVPASLSLESRAE